MTGLQALHDASHTMVMGVLNITEDSFSDGGLWLDPAKAAQHGRDMMAAGADIIDIGADQVEQRRHQQDRLRHRRRIHASRCQASV